MIKIDNNVRGQIITHKIYYYIKQSERNNLIIKDYWPHMHPNSDRN